MKLVSTVHVGLPANPAAAALTMPIERQILRFGRHAPYVQNYFDVDNAVAAFFADRGTPRSIVTAIDQAAARGQ